MKRTNNNKSKKLLYSLLIFSFLLLSNNNVFADGTRDFMQPSDVTGALTSNNQVAMCLFNFEDGDGTIGTPEATDSLRRYYVRIEDASVEDILLGFNIGLQRNSSRSIYFRIKSPDGTVVLNWTEILSPTNAEPSPRGYIRSFEEVFEGPKRTCASGTDGYKQFRLDLDSNDLDGDYIIEFNNNQSETIAGINSGHSETVIFRIFDISVGRENGNGNITRPRQDLIEGRFFGYVFSMYNYFSQIGFNNAGINLEYYAYQEKDLVMSKLAWTAVVGGGWNILFNSTGADSTGNVANDRKSVHRNQADPNSANPEYKVFFAAPDTSVFPVLDVIPVFNYLKFDTDVASGSKAFYFEVNRTGTIEVLLEFGTHDNVYTPFSSDRILKIEDANVGYNMTLWDGLDGLGVDRSTDTNTYFVSFKYSIGIINNPMYDVEQVNGGLAVTLYAPDPVPLGWNVQRHIYFDDTEVRGVSYYDYNGCLSGCHIYPDAFEGSSNHVGESAWMNSWWSSYDTIYDSTFVPSLNIYGNVVQDDNGVMPNPSPANPAYDYHYLEGPGIGVVVGEYIDTLFVILYEVTSAKGYEYVEYQRVNLDGTYKFVGVKPNTDFMVCLTNEYLPISTPAQLQTKYQFLSTPDDWYNIGEIHNNAANTMAGHDGSVDGKLAVRYQLSDARPSTTNVNFAIDDDNTLPIELLSFNAYCYNDQISIVWETASELNNNYFTLEKSYDMVNWNIIDIVQGAGTTNQLRSYNSYDNKNDRLVYYRLSQTDFDGKYKVFSPVSLDVCMDMIPEYTVDAYPNPSVNNVNIRINNYQYNDAILNVYNALGQNVLSTEMESANILIEVANWERGIYFAKINIGEEVIMKKIILE